MAQTKRTEKQSARKKSRSPTRVAKPRKVTAEPADGHPVEAAAQADVAEDKPAATPGDQQTTSSQAVFPVVGIGASAGGLAAFEAFFSAMPPRGDTGMAFVLVQHLSPDHKSLLAELVKRYTRMDVFEAENGMVVRPN